MKKRVFPLIHKLQTQGMSCVLMLAVSIGPIAASYIYIPVVAASQTGATVTANESEIPVTSIAVVQTAAETIEDTEVFVPSPDELNLAHYFSEGADQTKAEESLAGDAFKLLMNRDSEWLNSIYDYADLTPTQAASRLGRSTGNLMGKYNPNDTRHDPDDSSTWTINSFKKVRMTISDGDGQAVNAHSNVIDIMSMANLYTFYHDLEDYDQFLSYSERLWGISHSYSVRMSDAYYCEGCLGEGAEQREREELEAEAKAEMLSLLGQIAEGADPSKLPSSTNSATENNETASVIVAGTSKIEETSEEPVQETEPPSTSAVITSGGGDDGRTSRQADELNGGDGETSRQAAELSGGDSETSRQAAEIGIGDAEETSMQVAGMSGDSDGETSKQTNEIGVGDAAVISEQTTEMGVGDIGETAEKSVAIAPEAAMAAVFGIAFAATPSDITIKDQSASANSSTNRSQNVTSYQCPGHVDLIVNAKILGVKENKGLFSVDSIGNNNANITEAGWQGWTDEAKESVRAHSTQDWYAKYGLSVSSFSMRNPLSEAEIEEYMQQLPKDLSQARKDLIHFALSSVGKVPYYWGGKATSMNYGSNNFGILTTPDYKGRVLKGLDCSGWISWVYWSSTGQRLNYESTSGLALCGTRISRDELQPGDIIIRTGTEAHAIMFLGWTEDGRIRCIHESSTNINNVTVAIRDANWPYYRKLLD